GSILRKSLPIVLFGTEFWDEVLNMEAMVKYGTIAEKDLDLVFKTDSLDDAFDYIVERLSAEALTSPGGAM
ncbi:MAG: lysine decarboxylase, partial [Rhodospirillaceae bacterium]